ncbi:Alkanesulfonate monooxygenase [Gluconobacter oxydans H24]|uniref:LLM class flavin-dependent oxidoreductase n=1 Tax=Gluconobacter thailandicus TaxID=257438 RepID=UPI0002996278|nr:LLM class flavin-dependent oxidoreductase [Gluconobacter thailandicus]AFW02647.1 Alkanesulfonate monooxygenase [Gluconobacter oxydans H24]
MTGHRPPNDGSRRLLETATSRRQDERLWTGVASLTGAAGNSTGLVGTPEQVADALVEYYKLGIDNFLIRGFEPLEDARRYGRDLIPLVREKIAALEAQSVRAAG